jgi:hypothetical protein
MNESAKKIIVLIITFVLGAVACYAVMSWVLKERVSEYNGIIDLMAAENQKVTEQLGRVQTAVDRTADRIGTAANGIGEVAEGLDPVIDGLDESIRILSELTTFFDAVEAIIGGFGSTTPH